MEQIKIKHRLFEKVEDLSESSFIAARKDKKYEVIVFDYSSEQGSKLLYSLSRIYNSGIKSPKIFYVDKKAGYIVRELVQGENMMNFISKQDITEDIYKALFNNRYIAKVSSLTLNYEPDKWVLCDNCLYYMGTEFIPYDESKDLVHKYMRLWFNTKELAQYLTNNNLPYDKTRIKDEYSTNKEIVLMTVKYYK